MPPNPVTILADATHEFRNNVRRMRSRTLWEPPRSRSRGKENLSVSEVPYLHLASGPNVLVTTNTSRRPPTSVQNDPHKWDPVNGKIVIKVYVPSTDDIWRFKVPEDVSLSAFLRKVETKVGFPVVLGLSASDIGSEQQFRQWVSKRVRNGRNTPLTARPAWEGAPDTPSF